MDVRVMEGLKWYSLKKDALSFHYWDVALYCLWVLHLKIVLQEGFIPNIVSIVCIDCHCVQM